MASPGAVSDSGSSGEAANSDGPGSGAECPICVMFKEGGCKQQFDAFMDCGIEAEKGSRDYQDCVKMFDSMRECMQRNPAVFAHLLGDVNGDVVSDGGDKPAGEGGPTSSTPKESVN